MCNIGKTYCVNLCGAWIWMAWACSKNGWWKNSKEVIGRETRWEKKIPTLMWMDDLKLDLRNVCVRRRITKALDRRRRRRRRMRRRRTRWRRKRRWSIYVNTKYIINLDKPKHKNSLVTTINHKKKSVLCKCGNESLGSIWWEEFLH